jgi:uncharacterized protein YkwD
MTLRLGLLPALFATSFASLPALAQSAPKTVTPPSNSTRANPSAVLTRYQLALDQVAQGRLMEARVILQNSIRHIGDAPELNLLLGYLLQREGRNDEAREVLARVASISPAARVQLQQLQSQPSVPARPASAITTAPVNTSDEPATATHTRLAVTDQRLAKLEQSMLQMINAERAKFGLQPLVFNETLAQIGRAHSAEMRDLNYFSHDSPTRGLREPLDRYLAVVGRSPRLVAENIYRAWGSQHRLTDADIRKAHDALMNSPGHRANILLPNATRLGVGIAVNGTGDLWLTQTFDRP